MHTERHMGNARLSDWNDIRTNQHLHQSKLLKNMHRPGMQIGFL